MRFPRKWICLLPLYRLPAIVGALCVLATTSLAQGQARVEVRPVDIGQDVLLVIDGNTGQNALAQVKAFDEALGVTGLILTKLDGTAKGGVIAAIAQARPIPIRYIGVGESIDDLRPFDAEEFVQALFS